MAKRIRHSSELIFEARRIFADEGFYDDNQLLGCYRLIYATYQDTKDLTDNSILISGIEEVINSQEEKYIKLIRLRFWKNWNLKNISVELNLSTEGARINEERVIRIMRNNTNKFCVDEQITTLEYELMRLNSIKNGECVNYGMPVKNMGLSIRAMNCLIREGIRTAREILVYSEEDFCKIHGLGKKTALEIIQKTKALFPGWEPSKRVVTDYSKQYDFIESNDNNLRRKVLMLPIEKILLPTRAYNALKYIGVNTVEQLLDTPEEVFMNSKNFGVKTLQNVREKRKEILAFLTYDT